MNFKNMYWVNCVVCDRLHIWNKKTMELSGWKYTCRLCGTINTVDKKKDKGVKKRR